MNFRLKETHSCPTIAALTYGTRQCSNALEHATREVAEYGYCLREEVAGRMAISQKRRNRGSPTPLGHLGLAFSRAWVCFCSMCVCVLVVVVVGSAQSAVAGEERARAALKHARILSSHSD